MKIILKYFLVIIFGLSINCGEKTVAAPPGGVTLENPDQGLIYLSIDDEDALVFSVNLYNVQSPPVRNFYFEFNFDATIFVIEDGLDDVSYAIDYTPTGEFGTVIYEPNNNAGNVSFLYDFTGNMNSAGVVATVDLKLISGADMVGTIIEFGDIIFHDSNNEILYLVCIDSEDEIVSQYDSKSVCEDNGYRWSLNTIEMRSNRLCYIDEGIINQAAANAPMAEWEATGNYVWSPGLCAYQP